MALARFPAKKLLELVRLLPDEEIKFKLLENHYVQVTCDRKSYKLVGMSKENFPALPNFPHALVKIPAKLLASLIAKTTFAISLEESRYTLNGALLVLKPGSVTMVATDGHRLAMVETDHKFEGLPVGNARARPQKSDDRSTAPRRRVRRRCRSSISDRTKAISFFQFGRRLLTSRKLTGQFPNYEAVLPRDANKTIVLERGELQDALRRVSQLADQRSHAVKFMLAKEGVEISASSPEYGEAKEAIEKEFKGDPIAIGFNAQYLLDFLGAAADGPDQLRVEGRTIRRPAPPARRRIHALSLRRDADAHLITRAAIDGNFTFI